MSYIVIHRGRIVKRTDDIREARQRLRELGDTAYIRYGTAALREFAATHVPHEGDKE